MFINTMLGTVSNQDDLKTALITRLVKEGHITLHEAFMLSEMKTNQINPTPYILVPGSPYCQQPYITVSNPTTGAPEGTLFNSTSAHTN